MNPGYPGRAELPESLKALFRPVSMVLPDLALICEIMLMAEGFQMSKLLSRKFVILYKLCEDLLSKSRHYDWKLRAIKTTLYVAGGMKRDAPELSEDKVCPCHCSTGSDQTLLHQEVVWPKPHALVIVWSKIISLELHSHCVHCATTDKPFSIHPT